jgi:hypothetical protein
MPAAVTRKGESAKHQATVEKTDNAGNTANAEGTRSLCLGSVVENRSLRPQIFKRFIRKRPSVGETVSNRPLSRFEANTSKNRRAIGKLRTVDVVIDSYAKVRALPLDSTDPTRTDPTARIRQHGSNKNGSDKNDQPAWIRQPAERPRSFRVSKSVFGS